MINLPSKTLLASHTVASFYVQCLLSACRNCGLDSKLLAGSANICSTQLADPESRFYLSELKTLWELIVRNSADPYIGLKVGQNMPAGHWGLIETLALNSKNLGEAFKTSLKYWSLVTDTGKEFELHRENGEVRLSFVSAYYDYSYANESDITYLVRLLNLILGQDVKLKEVHLTHSLPGGMNQSDYDPYFHAPVLFGQTKNAVVFAEEILDLPIAGSNSQIKLIVDQLAARKLTELKQSETLSDKVRAYINHGVTDLENIAGSLHMSTRTLQRKLKTEGSTFHGILEQFRRHKTEALIMDGTYTFQQISFLLGYRDERAFYDAVKRWFRVAPTEAARQIRNKGHKTNNA